LALAAVAHPEVDTVVPETLLEEPSDHPPTFEDGTEGANLGLDNLDKERDVVGNEKVGEKVAHASMLGSMQELTQTTQTDGATGRLSWLGTALRRARRLSSKASIKGPDGTTIPMKDMMDVGDFQHLVKHNELKKVRAKLRDSNTLKTIKAASPGSPDNAVATEIAMTTMRPHSGYRYRYGNRWVHIPYELIYHWMWNQMATGADEDDSQSSARRCSSYMTFIPVAAHNLIVVKCYNRAIDWSVACYFQRTTGLVKHGVNHGRVKYGFYCPKIDRECVLKQYETCRVMVPDRSYSIGVYPQRCKDKGPDGRPDCAVGTYHTMLCTFYGCPKRCIINENLCPKKAGDLAAYFCPEMQRSPGQLGYMNDDQYKECQHYWKLVTCLDLATTAVRSDAGYRKAEKHNLLDRVGKCPAECKGKETTTSCAKQCWEICPGQCQNALSPAWGSATCQKWYEDYGLWFEPGASAGKKACCDYEGKWVNLYRDGKRDDPYQSKHKGMNQVINSVAQANDYCAPKADKFDKYCYKFDKDLGRDKYRLASQCKAKCPGI
jgi:hypothetical protein